MIRMFQSQTAGHAKSYFRDALSKADYYIDDQEMNGTFNGTVARLLKLEGRSVDKETFDNLCDNINPVNGSGLTPRTVKDRRVGYDISFHAPKSVSILHGLSDDDTVLDVFRSSVHDTMLEIEADMQTRVRSQGQYDDRATGSLLWADFVHQTARPVDGHPPDPHLHCHCFTFNVTYDKTEGRFKAGQFHNIKRDMPYYQARFQKRLADRLSEQGYGIRKTRNGFEVAVIPQTAIEHFSKRTNLIGQVAKDKGITNRKELDELGAKTRGKKQKSLTMPELQEQWRDQLIKAGIDDRVKSEVKTTDHSLTPEKAVDHAIDHVFTRSSVKRDRQILAESYLHAIDNRSVSMDAIDTALKANDTVFEIQSGSQTLCTTALVLKEERKMVTLARDGLGTVTPFKPDFKAGSVKSLGEEQDTALRHVLTSQDRLTMIRGGAGTGKTTMIKHAVEQIESTGRTVTMLAPTAKAAHDVLKKQGFGQTDTVAKYLVDQKLQEASHGHVIWVDEAGMLGTQDMANILEIATTNKSRVILSGDPRQHSAVDRGDAMRILKSVGMIPQASLETVYRQKQDAYKQAVTQISKGNISGGFKQLDAMNAIEEIDYTGITQRLTEDYLTVIDDKHSCLVVTPTRDQAQKVNESIRQGLKERKVLNKRDYTVTILQNRYLTNAQKSDTRVYAKGDIIQAHQNMKGVKRGGKAKIDRIENGQIFIKTAQGTIETLDTARPHHFDVYRARDIALSKGDQIRITKNSFDENKKRINNGTVLTVKSVDKKGRIRAVKESANKSSSVTLPPDFGNLDYAYCSTSYSSQGKTVNQVLINQPSVTFPASNQKQFYVAVSRGRDSVKIYTDDKDSLLKSIEKSGDRQAATELIPNNYGLAKTVDIDIDITPDKTEITKTIPPTKDKDHEPNL